MKIDWFAEVQRTKKRIAKLNRRLTYQISSKDYRAISRMIRREEEHKYYQSIFSVLKRGII